MDLVVSTSNGLYCVPGDFYIDPWKPVARAVITHGHADHARGGSGHYLTATSGAAILRKRLGDHLPLQTVEYGQILQDHDVQLSLHPAGHVLGSAQVRLEHRGQVWVVSGDYKTEDDGTCAPFIPVRCHTFITESTFALPIYQWPTQAQLKSHILAWWRSNAEQGRTSVAFCYSLGKAQRILAMLDPSIGPILTHGAVERMNAAYRETGVNLPPTQYAGQVTEPSDLRRSLVLAPPSAQGTAWVRRFGDYADAFASGWMQVRGTRRRRGVDRGFVMSDHADWSGLQQAVKATGAQRVIVTHGQVHVMVRWLRECGLEANAFPTEYGEEDSEGQEAVPANAADLSPDKIDPTLPLV
ncbi:MAG: ligase-associated DNA damage response exonuclease [Verrucomicrobiales bacterium]|nr:ligase-associated DNA damage response exonuclease [Verrucomicrobiales bacterium]